MRQSIYVPVSRVPTPPPGFAFMDKHAVHFGSEPLRIYGLPHGTLFWEYRLL